MRLDLKKNEKITKLITVVLIGLLLLVVAIPAKNNVSTSTKNNGNVEVNEMDLACKRYEERLDQILEKSYGKGTIEVMVNLEKEKKSYDFMGENEDNYKVSGVLVVAHVKDVSALSDISYAVCALFDLPVHKVAVVVR